MLPSNTPLKMKLTRIPIAQKESLSELSRRNGRPRQVTDARYCAAALVGHRIYVTGRICTVNRLHACSSVVAILDLPRSTWRWIYCKVPGPIGCSMFLYDDTLYRFGGRANLDYLPPELSRFDLVEEMWSSCYTTGTKPVRRSYFSGHFIENRGRFLVFGGIGPGGFKSDVSLLQMPECLWIQPKVIGNPPSKRQQHGSCVVNDVFYCYGGWGPGGRIGGPLFLLHLEYGNTVTWSQAKTNAEDFIPLSSFSFLRSEDKLLILGGNQGNRFHHLSIYKLRTRRFEHCRDTQKTEPFWYGNAAVPIENGREFVILGGDNRLDCYLRLTVGN